MKPFTIELATSSLNQSFFANSSFNVIWDATKINHPLVSDASFSSLYRDTNELFKLDVSKRTFSLFNLNCCRQTQILNVEKSGVCQKLNTHLYTGSSADSISDYNG